MKVLDMLSDVFDKLPRPRQSIKGFINEQRRDSKGDSDFFHLMIEYLGGRSYNEFLDYSLLAIKLNAIYNKHCYPTVQGSWDEMKDAIERLLGDDRHDLWQNLPYILDRIAELINHKHGPDKVKAFWFDVVGAVVDCVNVTGTKDVSVSFTIEEG